MPVRHISLRQTTIGHICVAYASKNNFGYMYEGKMSDIQNACWINVSRTDFSWTNVGYTKFPQPKVSLTNVSRPTVFRAKDIGLISIKTNIFKMFSHFLYIFTQFLNGCISKWYNLYYLCLLLLLLFYHYLLFAFN